MPGTQWKTWSVPQVQVQSQQYGSDPSPGQTCPATGQGSKSVTSELGQVKVPLDVIELVVALLAEELLLEELAEPPLPLSASSTIALPLQLSTTSRQAPNLRNFADSIER